MQHSKPAVLRGLLSLANANNVTIHPIPTPRFQFPAHGLPIGSWAWTVLVDATSLPPGRTNMTSFAVTLGLFASLQVPTIAPSERYYMVLFGAQSVPFNARYTHTFATFVRTEMLPVGERVVAVDTVSWMPAAMKIRPFAVFPEPGVNLALPQTFDWITTFEGRVSKWGPYEIDADRYTRFIARKTDLESGKFEYRAVGALTRNDNISNCGQSFSRASPIVGRRYLQPTPSPGENGTSDLARRYLRVGAFQDNGATHDWLIPAIQADVYPSTTRRPGDKVPYFRR